MTAAPFAAARWHLAAACLPHAMTAEEVAVWPAPAGAWDLSSNAAMVAAPRVGQDRAALAREVAERVGDGDLFARAEATPNGLLNLRVRDAILGQVVLAAPSCPVVGQADPAMWHIPDAASVPPAQQDAFRVLYAYARCRSVLRHAGHEAWPIDAADSLAQARWSAHERRLLVGLAQGADIFRRTAQADKDMGILKFLYGLAHVFDTMWDHESGAAPMRVLWPEDPAVARTRLALVAAVAHVIRAGLGALGVQPIEELR